MVIIQNPQKQCSLLILQMFSVLPHCSVTLELGLCPVDVFWVALLENPIWQLNLSLARFSCGLVVLENCQMLLILSPRLLMLHWLDHCSLNGAIFRE